MEQQVVAHAAADEAFLHAGQGVDSPIEVEQLLMAGVEVRTYLRMDAAGALAVFTGLQVAAVHAVHIGRRASEVAQVALEVFHLYDLLHLAQDAFFRAAGNEFALVGRDGTEGTAAKASAVNVDAVLDHLVGRDALALILGMGQACVGQVEAGVELRRGHGRVGGIDDD